MRGRGVFAKERADERAQGDGSFVLPKPGNPDPPDSGYLESVKGTGMLTH